LLPSLLALAACRATPPEPATTSEPTALAFIGGRVYTTPDAPPIDDSVVLVQSGRITAVGSRATTSVPPSTTTIECTGLVVTAGFQNSHVHFTPPGWTTPSSAPAREVVNQLLAMLTRWGFTTVVDTGSDPAMTGLLRRRIESGEVSGPRILTAGLPLYPPNGVPYYVRETVPANLVNALPQPASPDETAALVRGDSGSRDVIKLFAGSWIDRNTVRPMPADIAASAVREAHALGKLVFAHPSNVAGLDVALSAGVDVLAHAIEDTDGFMPSHLDRMKRQNLALVPTFTLFEGAEHVIEWVRRYASAGGQILFGTDVGYLENVNPADEYAFMARAGIGYREVLASLTTSPAQRFREEARRGRVAPGLEADLVVLWADPALDPRAFADVRYTVREGRIIYAAADRTN